MLRVFVARPDQKSTAGMDRMTWCAAAPGPCARPHRPAGGDRNAALFLLSDEASFSRGGRCRSMEA